MLNSGMQTFREFTEPFSPNDYPLCQKYAPAELAKVLKYFNEYAGKPIPNPYWATIKSATERLVSAVMNYDKTPDYAVRYREQMNGPSRMTWDRWDDGANYLHNVPGKLKKLLKDRKGATGFKAEYFEWMISRYTELNVLATEYADMKTRVFKRQPKTAEQKASEKQRYVAPMGKIESGQQVMKVLTDLTNSLKVDYSKAVTAMWVADAESIDVLPYEQQKKLRTQVMSMGIWDRVSATGRIYDPNAAYKLKADYKKTLTKAGIKAGDDMQEQFIYKNAAKLVSILEAKPEGLSTEPKILRMRADAGVFEGDIQIRFTDGSSFRVTNKVVVKRNQYGTVFNQFPTTFHDVIMPNGKPMGSPSEERMNMVFTKG
jgi:hypothetical protein